MPIRCPKFRIRTLMAGGAIVALLIGGVQLHRHRLDYLERADRHARCEEWYDRAAVGWSEDDKPTASYAAQCREYAALHGRLRWKYERAARMPWIAAQADPDEPKEATGPD